MQLLFRLRTRMVNVKNNFSSMYDNLNCELCDDDELDSQKHLIQCKKLLSMSSDQTSKIDLKYDDIFSEPEEQLRITQYMQIQLKHRESLLNKSDESGQ